jgi:GABA permease
VAGARAAAQARLDESLAAMRAAGVDAAGEIGDGDPIQAIEDAVRTFRPDELIVSTHPPGRSHWLERGVVEKARTRFDVPLTHVVVDLDASS